MKQTIQPKLTLGATARLSNMHINFITENVTVSYELKVKKMGSSGWTSTTGPLPEYLNEAIDRYATELLEKTHN